MSRPSGEGETTQIAAGILVGPEARAALGRGAARFARLVAPTLGPCPRTVIVGPIAGRRPPEILEDAATIARRVYRLGDRYENQGAMLMRHVAWRVHEAVGDGSATAVVLADALLQAAHRGVAAGLSPVALRSAFAAGGARAAEALREIAMRVEGRTALERLASHMVEAADAAMVAEVVDSIHPPEAAIVVEDAPSLPTTVQYVEGIRWDSGWLSPAFAPSAGTTVRLDRPRILVTDIAIEQPEQLVAALEACRREAASSLFIVATTLSDASVGLLRLNQQRGDFASIVAVKAPASGELRHEIMFDLAAATGARFVDRSCGSRLEDVAPGDLGAARLAWVRRAEFAILGGAGDRAAMRQRLAGARRAAQQATGDAWARRRARERVARLAGTGAVISVGAPTEAARSLRKRRIEVAIETLRAASAHGVVPGGGIGLCRAATAVEAMAFEADPIERRAGLRMVAHALRQPTRTVFANAGLDAGPIPASTPPNGAYDVLERRWVDATVSGIADPIAVLEVALRTAVGAVASILGTEAIVLTREPGASIEP